MHRAPWLLLVLALASAACTAAPPASSRPPVGAPAREGRLAVEGGRIWYRVASGGGGTPVVLLHGGPGYNSFYLKPLERLADQRAVVRYDQLGSGKSDAASDTALFAVDRFVRELEALRAHLGYPRVHLLGHSWGANLAVEYYRAHPDRVASLVLGSASLDVPAWERNARQLMTTLPDSMQRAIRVREAEDRLDAPDYQAAMSEFNSRYVWLRPVQVDADSSAATMNTPMYRHMWGLSEFTITGTLKDYDATPFLPQVGVPVLYTVGERDEAGPEIVRGFARLTPGARVEVIPDAAHMTTWDNPDHMLRAVRDFLREVDSRRP